MTRSKKDKGLQVADGVVDAIFEKEKKSSHVIAASIQDDFCNYSIEFLTGKERGEISANKKRKLLISDDLRKAFAEFPVHMAILDDAFKLADEEVTSIRSVKNDDKVFNYTIEGFKIAGKEENEGIILIGTKNVTHGWIKFETPKVMIDKSSSYPWYNELKEAADKARHEVELYRDGKGTPVEPEEEKDDTQGDLFNGNSDDSNDGEGEEESEGGKFFEGNKV